MTTDFREPIAAVLQSHMQLTDSHIDKVFPRRPRQRGNLTGIIRA